MHLHLSGFYKFLFIMDNRVFQMNCWFEGHVQGVGFRYQTVGVAKGFDVTGYVQNMVDGRVHLYAEGEESEVVKKTKKLLLTYPPPSLFFELFFLIKLNK